MLKSLYGTEITEKHCIGYCKKHGCYITSKQLKHKEYLRKQCRALDKKPHEFWTQREMMKMAKRQRRELA